MPVAVLNRPGLGAIAYRIGTFGSFREAMVHEIARQEALRGLTTRRSDDYAITVLELWAAVADVLTFYQERIANEAFLRTARERDSILRLVRLLDYQLRPGLATTTRLAFAVDDGAKVRIPVGLKVMSVPGQDERPQFFETVKTVVADARLNRLPVLPRPIPVNPLASGRPVALLTSDAAGWLAAKTLKPRDRVVLFNLSPSVKRAPTVVRPSGDFKYGEIAAWGLPRRAIAPAPEWRAPPDPRASLAFWVEACRPVFTPLPKFSVMAAPEEKEVKEVKVEGDRFVLVWTSPVVGESWNQNTQVRVFTRKMKLFGFNAPASYATVTPGAAADSIHPHQVAAWLAKSVGERSTQPVWASKDMDDALRDFYRPDVRGRSLPLDAAYKDLAVGDELLICEGGRCHVVTIAGLSDGEAALGTLPKKALADHRFRSTVTTATISDDIAIDDCRKVALYLLKGPAVPLWPADLPQSIDSGELYLPATRLDEAGESVEVGRTISGQELKPGVALRLDEIDIGRTVLLEDHAHRPVSAVITGRWVETVAEQDFLRIDTLPASPVALDTATAVLLGNVALATHGETAPDDILGDGDASLPFQRFTLRRKPLTYVPSARTTRGESTLRVLVDSEAWTEVDSLYGQSAKARVYTARQADDGTTSIQCGDGITGARLPSGRGNVVARYRQGLGLEGRMRSDQLTILMDRPPGLKSVTNPAPADGGADPERLDQARETAPITVKTFDRAVSLQDFAYLAIASGEVAKAMATSVWHSGQRAVHLSVAAQRGAALSVEALDRLHSALTRQRDPNHVLLLGNVCRVPVILQGTVRVDGLRTREDVLTAARASLRDCFAFERMNIAEPLHLSDLYRVLHEVPGVVSVDIDVLHFKGFESWTTEQLQARGATADPLQQHLGIFAARSFARLGDPVVARCYGAQPPEVLPAEQAFVESEAEDIQLRAVGQLK